MWSKVKSGEWLTRERMRAYAAIILIVSSASVLIWLALADGLIDRNGKPIGTDFSNVWAAGRLALDGDVSGPYDPVRQHAAEKAAFGDRDVPFFGWHYPPIFLTVAAGLALLPYAWALAVWMAMTLSAMLWVLRAILPRPETLLLALAFPATFINLGHGQNGFLTAALLGGGLLFLDKRPTVAGVLIGLLAYKPQFGLLVPFVLIATARWRVFAAAAITLIAVSLATFALFGAEVWTAFAKSTSFTRLVLEEGGPGWATIQSLFSAVRMWGGGIQLAYIAQAGLAIFVAMSLIWLWRSPADRDLKAAALPCACLLATPYVLDYDLVVLAVSLCFVIRHGLTFGFREYEATLLSLVWVAPLLARTASNVAYVPLGLIATAVLYTLVLRRAAGEVRSKEGRRESLARA